MRFEERLQVPVPRSAAWSFLWQTERLAACIPGCEELEEIVRGQSYKAVFADRIGPYQVRFDMTISVVEAVEPERVKLTASGRDARMGVSQKLELTVGLDEPSPAVTGMNVVADVEILGRVATLGQFVIKRKVKSVIEQFTENVRQEMAQG